MAVHVFCVQGQAEGRMTTDETPITYASPYDKRLNRSLILYLSPPTKQTYQTTQMAGNAQYPPALTNGPDPGITITASPPSSDNNESASAAPKVKGDPIDAQFIPFKYAPLDSTRKQIRVLKLCGATDGIIKCTLQTVEIGHDSRSKISYRALSYTWGPEKPTHRVLINDQVFEVRQNLYDFLVMASERCMTTFSDELWIDQICINQDDVLEKNHQVSMMASIYEKAEEVVVWLGGLTAEQEAIMPYIEFKMAAEYGRRPGAFITYQTEPKGPELSTVIEFFQNPYWTRMWIVQELTVSCDFTVYGPHFTLSGYLLRCFAIWLDDHIPATEPIQLMSPHVMYLLTRAPGSGAKYLLSDLLKHLDKGLCFETKDRVYALRALLQNGNSLVVDYRKPNIDVLLDAVRLIGKETIVHSRKQIVVEGSGSRGHAAHVVSCDLPKAFGLGTSKQLFEELVRDENDEWHCAYQAGNGEDWILEKFREHFLGPGKTADETGDMEMGYAEPNFSAEMNLFLLAMERP